MKTQGQFILFETLDEFAQFLQKPVARSVVRIQNHHTLIPSYADFNGQNHFARLVAMKTAHLNRKPPFSDIGQNLTIFPDGTVAVCRSFEKDPACAKGANGKSVCIENLGNFDTGRDQMTAAQRKAIIQVNALLCRRFKLKPTTDTIVYHHWFDLNTGARKNGAGTTKSCPGTAFFGGNKVQDCEANFLPLVRQALEELTGTVAATPTPTPISIAVVSSSDGRLTIRAAPSAKATRLGELVNGDVVHIHGAKGIWRRIDPVHERWVSSRFLVPG